jgi:hypothetical protein
VNAELTKPGQGEDKWYKRWYVAAAAGVLVAGAVTTTVVLAQDRDSVPVDGMIQ